MILRRASVCSRRLGARVCVDPASFGEEQANEIRAALLENKLLVFDGITDWTQRAMVHFFEMFATPLQQAGRAEDVGSVPEVFEVSNRGADSPFLSNKTIPWHSDLSYRTEPGSLGALYSRVIPSGSTTLWADCTAACENLDPSFREDIKDLRAVHRHPEPHMNDVEPQVVTHPILRQHRETGEHSIFVSPYFTTSVVGVSSTQSKRILEELFSAVTRPEVIYEHVWETDQLVLYDNRNTNHSRPAFTGERVLWRTQAREAL